ncbi:unnamed protein product [Caenorhabditis auriculariae]|uniref:Uncharacterized protein n=1 Tax=Caenorhabditis auriculariae TaxID=2777116 RepID=A0A8S1HF18_9PELO|nr:unnamed protein product [Caenorhabditis auriculariae]
MADEDKSLSAKRYFGLTVPSPTGSHSAALQRHRFTGNVVESAHGSPDGRQAAEGSGPRIPESSLDRPIGCSFSMCLRHVALLATALLCVVFAASTAKAASKTVAQTPEVKKESADAHYGGGPSYGNAPPYPQYPAYSNPNYDVNYCSVHASFPLVGGRVRRPSRRHRDRESHDRVKRQYGGAPAYGGPPPAYGNGPSYGYDHGYERPRRFDRQACRHTAIASNDACNDCCKVASRIGNNNGTVIGALFVFDPKLDWDSYHKRKEDDEKKVALQCVCCAPRRI